MTQVQSDFINEIKDNINSNNIQDLVKNLTTHRPGLTESDIKELLVKTQNPAIIKILDKFLGLYRVVYGENTQSESEAVHNVYTHNKMENRHMQLLYNAFLMKIKNPNYNYTAYLVKEIYNYLRDEHKNTNNEIFSRYSNLKNKGNVLAEEIYDGIITPREFVFMTPEDMKGDNLRELEAKLLEKGIFDSTIPEQTGETDLFKCPKCGKRKAIYGQLQTRSADEPMTTYIRCCCGHVWKF
ncbi:putative transcription elongation factor S-II [Cucumispora dikerogammari]|nr:putative transcription elongation factor S-II [Cucumispora dikerogammari]